MRLHRLRLDAVGPYATTQEVDFDQLSASGLFLLEGPTGAGKSTILDAVTFALYGELSSETSAKDRLHSDFAEPGRTPTVALEWSVRGRRLRITRTPEHDRPSRRTGGGTVKQAASVHLEQLEDGQWMSLSANKAETGQLVSDLMGLSRAQFTQVVLLPQGEFARFLRADDDTRRALLTKLFGTHLFDRVTAELEDGRHDAQRARAETQHHVEQALAAAAQAAGLDGAARTALVALGPGDLPAALADIEQRVLAADQQAQVAAELARGRADAAASVHEQARALAEQVLRVVRAQEQVAEHESTRAEHQERAATLDTMLRAEPVRPLLAALEECRRALQEAQVRLGELVAEPSESMGRGEGSGQARAAARHAAAQEAALAHLVALEGGLTGRAQALAEVEHDAVTAQGRFTALSAELAALPALVAEVEARQVAARVAAARLQSANELLPHARARLAAAQEAATLDPQVLAAHREWTHARERRSDLVREHDALLTRRLAGMSAELASELEPGMPCAVCGSLEHPMPAPTQGAPVLAADLERAAELRDEADATCQMAEGRLRDLTTRLEVLTALMAGGDLAELGAEVDQLDQVVAEATDAAAHVRSTDAELAGFRERSTELQTERTELAARQAALDERVAADSALIAADQARVAAELDGYPSVQARGQALHHVAEHQVQLADRLTEIAAADTAHRQALGRAETEAMRCGFADLSAARDALAEPTRRAALQAQVSDWEHRLTTLQALLGAPDLAGVDGAVAPQVLQQLEQAQAAFEQASTEHQQAALAYSAAGRTAQAWSQCMSDVRRAKAAHARTHRSTAAVIRLAALAKGTEGQRRVSLTTYVLRHWFHRVVQVANLRLSAMSAGRYELERVDEAESKAKRAGLTLTVIDRHTGERRHPTSLSGGETFFTSLALALGLADVVQAEAGGVDLDTLFIDEGFGTLDPSTLDQVMSVIDDLRDRGRVVGIVSHVPELKDRVPERLEVRRIHDGSSVVRVVA